MRGGRARWAGGTPITAKKRSLREEIEVIQIGELRKLLGKIAEKTLEKWLADDKFPRPIWRGNRRFWFLHEVEAWLKGQPRKRSAA